MSFISYVETTQGKIIVKLFNRRIGMILRVPHGFVYRPTGSRETSEVFKTLPALKRSLESAE